jgi:hypothetical protein
MYKPVTKVVPLADYRLMLTFGASERRVLDLSPYLEKGVFSALKDKSLFAAVRVSFDTIAWPNGADLCPEFLYLHSEPEEACRQRLEGVPTWTIEETTA